MTPEAEPRPVAAVVFAVNDVLVPFRSVAAWQWAWRPQGPRLGDRHVQAAVRRALKEWDRRRWHGLTGKSPPADRAALEAHLGETLQAVARRSLPAEERDAVVRRMFQPKGELERFPDVEPALGRLRARGVHVGALTYLPTESARWLLQRSGFPAEALLGRGTASEPAVPAGAAFLAAAERLGAPVEGTVFVGSMSWSDARAAQRAGLRAVLLDRAGAWPHLAGGRIASLAELDAALERSATPIGGPSTDDAAPGAEDRRSSGDFL